MGTILSILRRCVGISNVRSGEKEVLLEKSLQTRDPNAELASELRGQKVHIDMTRSFENWPHGARHAEYKRLGQEVNRVLEM